MKRVLVITYYWPPGGGSGVQRWLKFVKYLPEVGWTPTVVTPEDPEHPVLDPSLEAEVPDEVDVIRRPIREPYSVYKRLMGQRGDERVVSGFLSEEKRPSAKQRLSMWVRGNLFIPDPRRFWVGPTSRYLISYLRENPVDAIVSTGPPHSMHLVALAVHRATGTPWLADFRDPWTNIDFYSSLMLSGWADRKHRALEREVVTTASKVVVVTPSMQREFAELGAREPVLIPNGYDEADLPPAGSVPVDDTFTIVHVGLLNRDRDHAAFWQALSALCARRSDVAAALRVRFVGKVDHSAREAAAAAGLADRLEVIDYLPHAEVVAHQRRARVLYLPINRTPNAKGIVTGKLFEYLAADRPVLCVGPPDGDAAAILVESGAGVTLDFDDVSGIERWLEARFDGGAESTGRDVSRYSRRVLTGELARVLESL